MRNYNGKLLFKTNKFIKKDNLNNTYKFKMLNLL